MVHNKDRTLAQKEAEVAARFGYVCKFASH